MSILFYSNPPGGRVGNSLIRIWVCTPAWLARICLRFRRFSPPTFSRHFAWNFGGFIVFLFRMRLLLWIWNAFNIGQELGFPLLFRQRAMFARPKLYHRARKHKFCKNKGSTDHMFDNIYHFLHLFRQWAMFLDGVVHGTKAVGRLWKTEIKRKGF